jgi:hypothetical protein
MASQSSLAATYARDGYCVVSEPTLARAIQALRHTFEDRFLSRFNDDAAHNRNLIKRFGDTLDVTRFMSSPHLEAIVRDIGVQEPVFCGPVVTHYTSHDLTGQSYGLPFHQDWPSMGSSDNGLIIWFNLTDSGPATHGIEVAPGFHRNGILDGENHPNGYILKQQSFPGSVVPAVAAGGMVFMSALLPHQTYVNPAFTGWKLSLSRRFDDLRCPAWPTRRFANAYGTVVNRELFTSNSPPMHA